MELIDRKKAVKERRFFFVFSIYIYKSTFYTNNNFKKDSKQTPKKDNPMEFLRFLFIS